MKHNQRTPLKASEIPADLLNLRSGERSVVCPDCKTWRTVENRMITAHRAEPHSGQPRHRRDENHVSRCPGSGQRIWFDITPEKWLAKYERLANRRQNQAMDAGARHTTRVKRMGSAVAPPVSKVTPAPLTAAAAQGLPRPLRGLRGLPRPRRLHRWCTSRRSLHPAAAAGAETAPGPRGHGRAAAAGRAPPGRAAAASAEGRVGRRHRGRPGR